MKIAKRSGLKKLLWCLLLSGSGTAGAAPIIEMGEPESYCVVFCYVRAPFTVSNYGPGQKVGRVFCELEADVTARFLAYKGEIRTKNMKSSSIGVFKTRDGKGLGDVEMNTGVTKKHFQGAKIKKISCHF